MRKRRLAIVALISFLLALLTAAPVQAVTVDEINPTDAGSSTDIPDLVGAATHWQAVLTYDGDTSYVSNSTGVAELDLYEVDNPTDLGDVAYMQVRAVLAGDGSARIATKSGGTTYYGPEVDLGSAYTEYTKIYLTDPDTSSSWLLEDIDDIEVGVELTGGTNPAKCTEIYAIVYFVIEGSSEYPSTLPLPPEMDMFPDSSEDTTLPYYDLVKPAAEGLGWGSTTGVTGESFVAGDDGAIYIPATDSGAPSMCQTFTAQDSYTVSWVSVKLYVVGNIAYLDQVYIGLFSTTVNSFDDYVPMSLLSDVVWIDPDEITTDTDGAWYTYSLDDPVNVDVGTRYAIVIYSEGLGVSWSNDVYWRGEIAGGSYDYGGYGTSFDYQVPDYWDNMTADGAGGLMFAVGGPGSNANILYAVLAIFVAIGIGTGAAIATGSALLAIIAVAVGLVVGVVVGVLGAWVVIVYIIFSSSYLVASRGM